MKRVLLACAAIVGMASPALAEGVTAVAPLPDYMCAILNITDEQAMDRHFAVPIMLEPSATSQVVGDAASIVVVKNPVVQVNDYDQVLLFNGKPGWIRASALLPYSIKGRPQARCVPSVLSNGRIGFGPG